jgi:hypothetical protein
MLSQTDLIAGCKTPRTAFSENKDGIDVRNQAPLEGGRFHMSSQISWVANKVRGVFAHTDSLQGSNHA